MNQESTLPAQRGDVGASYLMAFIFLVFEHVLALGHAVHTIAHRLWSLALEVVFVLLAPELSYTASHHVFKSSCTRPTCPSTQVEDMALAISTMKRSVELYGTLVKDQKRDRGTVWYLYLY